MQVKTKRSICENLKQLFMKFDFFGREMDSAHNYANLKLFKSLFGTILSILFFGTLLNYTVYKFDNMRKFDDTNIMMSQQENFFSDEFIVKGTKGSF